MKIIFLLSQIIMIKRFKKNASRHMFKINQNNWLINRK